MLEGDILREETLVVFCIFLLGGTVALNEEETFVLSAMTGEDNSCSLSEHRNSISYTTI